MMRSGITLDLLVVVQTAGDLPFRCFRTY